ncbi:unnamed protein product [Wuchereria bancrofti]|uniref:Uncharacterized protein n=1 Tax=Wuchereria bancrofti TaxID=6293 RepID=A0A3P7E5F9_WUCBA|nr:unnamed protein product [Wuchereria bancrofti]
MKIHVQQYRLSHKWMQHQNHQMDRLMIHVFKN